MPFIVVNLHSNNGSIIIMMVYIAIVSIHTQTSFKSFNISDVIKGGSLGHGTVVPGHYDIDLVIYSRGMLMTW